MKKVIERIIESPGAPNENSAATWDMTGNSGVPTGWTVETADE